MSPSPLTSFPFHPIFKTKETLPTSAVWMWRRHPAHLRRWRAATPAIPPGCVRLPAGLRPFHPLPSLLPTSAFPGLVLTHVPHGPASCWCAPSPPAPTHQAQSIFIGSPDRDCPPWLFRLPGPSLASCSLSAQVPTPGHVLTSDCLVLCDLAMGVNQSTPGTVPSLEGRGHRPTSPGHTHDRDLSWVGIH